MSLEEQPIMIQPQHEAEAPSASSSASAWTVPDSTSTPLYNFAANSSSSERPEEEVDPQIIEALKSKDRIYVLKLGEVMESLIREGRMRADLTPATSYQRLLVHRCSSYYRLSPENDPVTKGISVRTTVDSRIPPRRICELVPAETTTQPAFQIMRRSTNSKTQSSRAGSDAGDLSDSETGSMASSKKRSNRTIEEREAAYNEARSRIFMNFDQKEKDSASSSTLSLVSTRDSGSVDDDSVGTPATESERSGPAIHVSTQDKRRGGSSNGGGTSSRRNGRDKTMSNGHDSSRSSRAASPSYATLYDPPPQMHGHDLAAKGPYPTTYYYYPPPPPGYMPPPMYGYYPPYPPYQPPNPNTNGESYTPPAQPHPYPYPYPWPPHPHSTPASPPPGTQPLPQPQQNGYSYIPPPYGYPMPPPQAYYTPPMMSSPELAPFEAEHGLWTPNDSMPPRRQRKGGGTWSYGPGIGQHGEGGTTGPRFNSRRTSNRSVNGDEESNASSSTSSSSRRTYTSSTTSSQHHPLPARPDWAVGLKPQPPHRHHNGHSSPARKQQQPPLPTDFPPLTSSSSSVQKPAAAPAGAWTNTRSILKPPRAEKDVTEGMQDLSLGQ